jgi:hypothetical protein
MRPAPACMVQILVSPPVPVSRATSPRLEEVATYLDSPMVLNRAVCGLGSIKGRGLSKATRCRGGRTAAGDVFGVRELAVMFRWWPWKAMEETKNTKAHSVA